jgi:23S rRNA G2069 N7-methylase RlmK/C1962 C5-methylase RlmI
MLLPRAAETVKIGGSDDGSFVPLILIYDMKDKAIRLLSLSKRTDFIRMLLIVLLSRRNVVQCLHNRVSNRFSLATSFRTASSTTTSPDFQSSMSKSKYEFPKVVLKRNQQSKTFRNGNPLIFSKAIERYEGENASSTISGSLRMADVVQVFVAGETNPKTHQRVPDVAIGFGVYNPSSLYRIRLLNHKFLHPQLYDTVLAGSNSSEAAIMAITKFHVESAIRIRNDFLNLPNSNTDTYRLINGEGDCLSGLAVDVISNNVVVMSSAAWCERYKTNILQVLDEALGKNKFQLIWKTTSSRLQQDGVSVVEPQSDEEDAAGTDNEQYDPSQSSMVVSRENGIEYETYPREKGQKTGVYADQRENRRMIASLCANKRVLDLCCYTGGFALNAALLASLCVGVDSSAAAIAMCKANAARNGITNVEFIQSDVTEYLQKNPHHLQYDIVILDPPKLAPMAKILDKARRKYHALNRDAMNAIDERNGGLLLTCSCSAAMTQAEGGQYFLKMVQGAALAAGRSVTLLSVSGAAPCHTQSPIAFPASSYLTAALFHVHPKVT